jgi:glycosyltransferase involved in cell wall biosynthesis
VAVFVPTEEPGELADRILEMLAASDKRKEIGERAQAYVRRFDWEKVVAMELKEIRRPPKRHALGQ